MKKSKKKKYHKNPSLKIIIAIIFLLGMGASIYLIYHNLKDDNPKKNDKNPPINLNYNIEKIPRQKDTSIFLENKYYDYNFTNNKFSITAGANTLLDMDIEAQDVSLESLVKEGDNYYALIKATYICDIITSECISKKFFSIKFAESLIWSKELDIPSALERYDTHIGINQIIYNFWDTQLSADYNCLLVAENLDGEKEFEKKFGPGELCMKVRPTDDNNYIIVGAKANSISLITINKFGKYISQVNVDKPLKGPEDHIFRPYLLDNLLYCTIESDNGEFLFQYNIDNHEEKTYDFESVLKENEKIGHIMHMFKQDDTYVAFVKVDKQSSSGNTEVSFEYFIINNDEVISRNKIMEINISDVLSIRKIKQIDNNQYLIEEQKYKSFGVYEMGTSWILSILN